MQHHFQKNAGLEKCMSLVRKVPKRVLVTVVCGALLLGLIAALTPMTHTYVVRDGQTSIAIQENSRSADLVLEKAGVAMCDKDVVKKLPGKSGEDVLQVYRAYSVHVAADGVEQDVILAMGSVSDVLDMANVELGEEDYVSVDLNEPTEPDMEIVVNRVNYRERTEVEPIPFTTVNTQSYLLGRGQSRIVSMGVNGRQEIVYKDKVVDGKVVESTVISSKVTADPKQQVVARGMSPRMPASLIEPPKGFQLNSKGIPTHYKRVITNAVSAAYSAKSGSYTASGMRAFQGTVAVNPKVIPYGTRLYITSADNRYVYGYAIAADTGTALRQGRIDVDLFFNSYEASCRWGMKKVNIYVLD